jgi:hypothetical protein
MAFLLFLGDVIYRDSYRITGVSDFIHRPDFNNYKKKNTHDVSETGSVSVLRQGETLILLGPLERANLNHWTYSLGFIWLPGESFKVVSFLEVLLSFSDYY